MAEKLIIKSLPIPPIANHRLVPVNGRLIKSKDSREFDKAIQLWILRQKSAIFPIRHKIKEWIDVGYCLKVDLKYTWEKSKIITKNGLPQRLDLDGRIKEILDALADIYDFDDKYVISLTASKTYWNKSWSEVNASIEPHSWELSDDS